VIAAPQAVPPADEPIDRLYEIQQANRAAVASTTASQRIAKLRRLEQAMYAHRDEILAASWADSRKPPAEVDLGEIYPVVGEVRHAIRHLRRWMRPRRVGTRLALFGSRSQIVYEPKGVVLILAPWNFPFNLTLSPLVSAVAAGNCAIVKPSEMTPASSACMKRILASVFGENEVALVEGGVTVSSALLRKRWDHIFFTGSTAVGRIVMKAAAEHLTPVTLELGGKSPILIDRTANLDDAARKLAWGKFFNSGQICIAPDYALVEESVHDQLVEKLRGAIDSLGSEGVRSVIVNDHHAARLEKLFDTSVASGAKVVTGGTRRGRELEPTVLANVGPDTPVMQEEIFGPLLPIVSYRTLDDAIDVIAKRERPLVLYIFSRDRGAIRRILAGSRAGATVINHTMVHFYALELPFGGVGQSGIGKSHGFAGFEAFSNARGVLEQKLPFTPIQLVFPPYEGKVKSALIKFMLRWL